jgi:glycerol-3-phosphate dehydrogenase
LAPHLPAPDRPGAWTARSTLPGGDFPVQGFEALVQGLCGCHPALDAQMLRRLARAYGSLTPQILGEAETSADLGRAFGAGLTEAEIRYLMAREWAVTAQDVVWRRSKLGLRLSASEIEEIDAFMKAQAPALVGGNAS